MTQLLPIIVMVAVFGGMMFFMSRGQKKKDKEIADMRNSLRVGDEVTTIDVEV